MLSILRWTVTISDSADESHAIYLHNLPHPTEDPYEVVWKHTKVGKLVNRAKSYSAFSGSRKAALELADKVEYWLTRHIRYASADLIIPAPPGNPDKAFDLPRFVADEVGGRLGLPVGLCTATGLTQPQKGVEQEIPELYSNIDGKYRAQSSLKGMTVIAMDDLYQSGATMNELVRACRAAGATTVLSLTFTKTAKFATGLTASDWYKVSMEAADTEGP